MTKIKYDLAVCIFTVMATYLVHRMYRKEIPYVAVSINTPQRILADLRSGTWSDGLGPWQLFVLCSPLPPPQGSA